MKVDTPETEILSKFVWPSTSKSWVIVVKPAILTLSKFVWPSTSKSPFKSEFPSTTKPSETTFPITLIPVLVVANFSWALWYISTSAFALATIAWLVPCLRYMLLPAVIFVCVPELTTVSYTHLRAHET